MEVDDRLHRLIRHAAVSAHPVFLANGWEWRDKGVPSARQIIERLTEMVESIGETTIEIRGGRFRVAVADDGDRQAGINIMLDLGTAWNAERFPEPEYDLVR